jgi:type I restriction enzyme S subunit
VRTRKPSGIEWAEEIPQDWEVKPLLAIGHESRTSNSGGKSDNLLSLSYGEVVEKDINSSDGLLPESFDTYQVIKPNDMVFRFTDLQNDKRSLRSAISQHSGIITSAYMAFTPRDCEPGFLAYLMRSYDLTKVFYAMGSGLRQSLKYSDVKRLPVILPPRPEQRVIVEFLDHETAQIDNLIAKQEQLIATLGERRKARIAALLASDPTRDGDAVVAPIKRFFTNLDSLRVPLSAEERGSRQGEFPYYGASGIIDNVDGYLFDDELVLVAEDGANLVNRSTPVAYSVSGKIWVNNHAHILKPLDGHSSFWAARLETLDFFPWVSGSAQPKLTSEALMNIEVSAPRSIALRAELGAEIVAYDQRTNDLLSVARQLTMTLRERRQALISAAVTGKIDVRG